MRHAPAATAARAVAARIVSMLTGTPCGGERRRPRGARAPAPPRASTRCGARTRRLASHIDDVRAVARQGKPVGDRGVGAQYSAAVAELSGVTLSIAHDERARSATRAGRGGRPRAGIGYFPTMRLMASARVAPSRMTPAHRACHGARAGLAHSAHRHAQVLRLDHDDHAAGAEVSTRASAT